MSKYNKFIEMICDKNLVHHLDSTVYDLNKENNEKAWLNIKTNDNDIDRPILQIVKDYSYNYSNGRTINKNCIKEYYKYDYGLVVDDRLFDEIEKWVDSFDKTEKWYNFTFITKKLNEYLCFNE